MNKEATGVKKTVTLRKYPNRRYYDTSRSRYVTLDEIYMLIRDGHEIEVSDSKTGQDITAKVLAQIILELDPPKLDVFPVPLLHRLIRANEQLVTDFVDRYFNQALTVFLDSQKAVEQSFRQAMGLDGAPAVLPEWLRTMWDPVMARRWAPERDKGPVPPAAHAGRAAPSAPRAGDSAAPAPAAVPPGDAAGTPEQMRETVEDLRRQLERLRAHLLQDSASPPRKRGERHKKGRTGGRKKRPATP